MRWVCGYLDRPAERHDAIAGFWTSVTGTRLSPRRGVDDEFVTLLPPSGDAFLKLQRVREGGGAHLDFHVEDVPATIERARALGASEITEYGDWTVVHSPAGMPFCVMDWEGDQEIPPPYRHPDGTLTRLNQICLDIGPGEYAKETAFWTEFTGWTRLPGSLPEFEVLRPPAGLPLRILFQRLGEDRPASAHVDFACSDVAAARALHERHGARVAEVGSSWMVMNDPAGLPYCLTGRDPEQPVG
jgi:glyoxalase superfamily protein